MKDLFKVGDSKTFTHKVTEADTATFESGNVHPVYATFAIARDAEWSSRLFVLEMKEPHEEGIGTYVEIQHLAPAFVDEEVLFKASVAELSGYTIHCSITASVGERLIATCKTGQKILPKEKLNAHFEKLKNAQLHNP